MLCDPLLKLPYEPSFESRVEPADAACQVRVEPFRYYCGSLYLFP
jgi:hypothetical protein